MNHYLSYPVICLFAFSALAAGATLEEALQKIARYDYDQGRQSLLEFENVARQLPARQVETQLIAFLGSKANLAGKDFVMRQLSVMGSEASVPALAEALANSETMEMARYALERIPGEQALEALRTALKNAPEAAKTGIVNSLGSRRDTKAVALLQPLSLSSDRALAAAAVAAMGRIASPSAVTALAGLRKNGSVPAMEASLVAAERLAAQGNPASAEKLYAELNQTSMPLVVRIGSLRGLAHTKQGISVLSGAIHDTDPKIQASALQVLGELKNPAASTLLIREYSKLPASARPFAVTALSRHSDRASLPVLVLASADENPAVRLASYSALSELADPSAVPLLAQAAASSDADSAMRDAARSALDRMRGKTIDQSIVSSISEANNSVKVELIRSAGERGILEASPVLLALLNGTDRAVRREAFKALRETAGAKEVKPLLALLGNSPSAADRRDLERALSTSLRRGSATGHAEMAAAFQSAQQPELKDSLLQVMGQAGWAGALPLLRSSLRDPNPDLVRAAILGLGEWPTDAPIEDLLPLATTGTEEANRILAQRAVIKLLGASTRPAAEAVPILDALLKASIKPEEKKAILAMLPRYPTKAALALAQSLESDPDTATEAKAASARLARAVSQK